MEMGSRAFDPIAQPSSADTHQNVDMTCGGRSSGFRILPPSGLVSYFLSHRCRTSVLVGSFAFVFGRAEGSNFRFL